MTESGQRLVRQETSDFGKLRYIMTVPVIWRPAPKTSFMDRFKKTEPVREFETSREFVFETTVVGKVSQIVSKIIDLPNELYGDTPAELAINVVDKNYKDMVYIIAASSLNSVEEPSKELLKFIEMNFTFDMLKQGAQIAITQLGLDMFLNCLMILKGTSNVLNPKTLNLDESKPRINADIAKLGFKAAFNKPTEKQSDQNDETLKALREEESMYQSSLEGRLILTGNTSIDDHITKFNVNKTLGPGKEELEETIIEVANKLPLDISLLSDLLENNRIDKETALTAEKLINISNQITQIAASQKQGYAAD